MRNEHKTENIKRQGALNPEGLTFTIWQAGRPLFKDLKAVGDANYQIKTKCPNS